MTGRIDAVKRFAVHDGDGVRTTVFFKGCPLRCEWCHNPECLEFSPEVAFYAQKCVGCGACVSACSEGVLTLADGKCVADDAKRGLCASCPSSFSCVRACPTGARLAHGEEWDAAALAGKLAEDRAFFEESGGGVTLSGGECLSQGEFALELLRLLHEMGISVDVDTSGCVDQKILAATVPYTDTYLYDLKAMDPDLHRNLTGRDNRLILSNLDFLCESGCRVEIRYPFVVGKNDGEAARIGEYLAGKPGIRRVTVLEYHDLARSKYAALGKADPMPEQRTTREAAAHAVEILRSYGLRASGGWED